MKKYLLWLDDNVDYRNPDKLCPGKGGMSWRECYFPNGIENLPLYWAKNYADFTTHIEANGLPVAISFDNDLGEPQEGVDCARWLFQWCVTNGLEMPMFDVHSANPICAKEIYEILKSDWEKFNRMKWEAHIGKMVEKKSGKPFKSTLLRNKIKGLIMSPITNKFAFTFQEDDSFVECRMIKLD